MFTAFLTKCLSSSAARRISWSPSRNGASPASLSCTVRPHRRANAARFCVLRAAAGPGGHLGPGVRRAIEKCEADRVAHAPIVEVAAPSIHLCRGHLSWVVDIRGQQARFVDARLPQTSRQSMVTADLPRQCLDVPHRDAQRAIRNDGVARHRVERGLPRVTLQPPQCSRDIPLVRSTHGVHHRTNAVPGLQVSDQKGPSSPQRRNICCACSTPARCHPRSMRVLYQSRPRWYSACGDTAAPRVRPCAER